MLTTEAGIDLRQVRSVTDFQRNMRSYVGKLKASRRPLVLTVNGQAELVVQDAESYQALLERLDHAETLAALKQGLAEADHGQTIPLGAAMTRLRKRHGISR